MDPERIAFRGYGMMLAEIGLPPGSEVDRASLYDAVKSTGWEINSCDVLPDHSSFISGPTPAARHFLFHSECVSA